MSTPRQSIRPSKIDRELKPESETYQHRLRQQLFDAIDAGAAAQVMEAIVAAAVGGDHRAQALFLSLAGLGPAAPKIGSIGPNTVLVAQQNNSQDPEMGLDERYAQMRRGKDQLRGINLD